MSEWKKAQIVVFVFFVAAAIMTPPDVISQLTLVFVMVTIYGLLVFIVSRFKSLAQTPESIKSLITVLVCLLTITISYSIFLFLSCHQLSKSYRQLKIEHSKCPVSQEQTQMQSQ